MSYSLEILYNQQEEELVMSRKTKQHTKQFKLDAINYRKEHPDLTQVNVPKISVLVSVPLVNGKHSLEIMMAIFRKRLISGCAPENVFRISC